MIQVYDGFGEQYLLGDHQSQEGPAFPVCPLGPV